VGWARRAARATAWPTPPAVTPIPSWANSRAICPSRCPAPWTATTPAPPPGGQAGRPPRPAHRRSAPGDGAGPSGRTCSSGRYGPRRGSAAAAAGGAPRHTGPRRAPRPARRRSLDTHPAARPPPLGRPARVAGGARAGHGPRPACPRPAGVGLGLAPGERGGLPFGRPSQRLHLLAQPRVDLLEPFTLGLQPLPLASRRSIRSPSCRCSRSSCCSRSRSAAFSSSSSAIRWHHPAGSGPASP
jgi:hypothetical protein